MYNLKKDIETLCAMARNSIGSGDPEDFTRLERFVDGMQIKLLMQNKLVMAIEADIKTYSGKS